jgi:AcrR family transcriptional regulator
VEGALRCIERLPLHRVTSRAIAEESGANLASITYHFDSKDQLLTEAVIAGLDRWLEEISRSLQDLAAADAPTRFRRAWDAVDETRQRHAGTARSFIVALAWAQDDDRIKAALASGFERTRLEVATLLGLGDDPVGHDAAGLALSMFYGLLLQVLVDPALAIEGRQMARAQARLRAALPDT